MHEQRALQEILHRFELKVYGELQELDKITDVLGDWPVLKSIVAGVTLQGERLYSLFYPRIDLPHSFTEMFSEFSVCYTAHEDTMYTGNIFFNANVLEIVAELQKIQYKRNIEEIIRGEEHESIALSANLSCLSTESGITFIGTHGPSFHITPDEVMNLLRALSQ